MAMLQDPNASERVAPAYRRSYEGRWRSRGLAFVLGFALALAALVVCHEHYLAGSDLVEAGETSSIEGFVAGRQVTAADPSRYAKALPTLAQRPSQAGEVLWLGNSQLYKVNQLAVLDTLAPVHAALALKRDVYGLALPNANLQEQLVALSWALSRRAPSWLVLPLVYDDLREDGLRAGLEALDSQATRATLATVLGARLVRELTALESTHRDDAQGTTNHGGSLQKRSEAALDSWLSRHFPVWADRGLVLAGIELDVTYRLRNWLFGITPSTKRPMIPLRYEKNMAAFEALLKLAAARNLRVVVYVAPIRHDVEPPYYMKQYEAWKRSVASVAKRASAEFADLDHLVPDELWGTTHGDAIDFMHFRGGGHRLLGLAIAERIRTTERSGPKVDAH